MPRGAKPKPPGQAVNRNPKVHEFKHAEAVGWQHGRTPTAPDGLVKASRDAWRAWFGAWWASFWTPADLPALRHTFSHFHWQLRPRLFFVSDLPPSCGESGAWVWLSWAEVETAALPTPIRRILRDARKRCCADRDGDLAPFF